MNYKKVVRHYGGLSKVSRALGLKRQTVHAWGVRDRIPPKWQLKIESDTDGKLKADKAARREAMEMAAFFNGG